MTVTERTITTRLSAERTTSARLTEAEVEAWDEHLRYSGEPPARVLNRLIRTAIADGTLLAESPRRAELAEAVRQQAAAAHVETVLAAVSRCEAVLDEMADANAAHAWLLADWLASTAAAYPARVEARSGVVVRVAS